MSITVSILIHNAISTLPDVIAGVEAQTVRPDRHIVVDNASDEPTRRYLSDLPGHYEIVYLPENLGVGAGHNTGWRLALEDPECEFIWTLENDSIPPKDCLESLLADARALEEERMPFGGIIPQQTHPEEPYSPNSHHLAPARSVTFNGALIPARLIHRLGYLREDFFVDQEDREYARRASAAELPFFADPMTTISHLGKGRNRRSTPSVLRSYYRVRNETYLRKSDAASHFETPRTVLRTLAAVVRSLLFEDMKWPRIQARFMAARDGLRGDLGKKDYEFLQH